MRLIAALSLLPVVAFAASGGAPLQVAHSGFVLGPDDQPLASGTLSLSYGLSNQATGGAGEVVEWQATCAVNVEQGYFAAVLGAAPCAGDGLDTADFAPGAERWLALAVNGVELLPRQRVLPNGVATLARDADRLGGELPATYHDAALLTGAVPAAALTNAVQDVGATGPISVTSSGTTRTVALTGTVPVANGGTGLTATGAAGQVLRSNGSAWVSQALAAADLPDLSGTYVTLAGAQTIGGAKTFSSATITGGTINGVAIGASTPATIAGTTVSASTKFVGALVDSGTGALNLQAAGVTQASVLSTASATNVVTLTGANGGAPAVSVAGTDSNIGLTLQGKGTGAVQLASGYVETSSACGNASGTTVIPNNPALQIHCLTLTAATAIQLPLQSALGLGANGVWNLTLAIKQNATGNVTPTWTTTGADVLRWDGGTSAPTVSTAANTVTLFQCITTAVLANQWYCARVFSQN